MICSGDMTLRVRGLTACLTVLFAVAGCIHNVPRYFVTPAKGQSDQQMNNDQFDCNVQAQKQTGYNPDKSLTEGALVGLLVGGAAGSGAAPPGGAGFAGGPPPPRPRPLPSWALAPPSPGGARSPGGGAKPALRAGGGRPPPSPGAGLPPRPR